MLLKSKVRLEILVVNKDSDDKPVFEHCQYKYIRVQYVHNRGENIFRKLVLLQKNKLK